ncbi:hypothetical protein L6J37_14270 [Photobacterium sp. WH77]|uniref:hypothetical protein n=1 Tax=unclassified Photobacterium TaxID=2628852 RepID=UPI001EDBFCF8|nr:MULTISPECIES: hypothetical protein [unclassified Photobacterium]MCG2838000.1 hypothetical protein [Photobacterium sp. WH77]MCG2845618.1 hypothetical protein [Photobacterium sp. WH80]
MNSKLFIIPMICCLFTGCSITSASNASIGNAGSTTGYHSIRVMNVKDTTGANAGFGYGALSSYPGKSADIGSIGIPMYVDGYWAKYNADKDGFAAFYRISKTIDSNLAKQKIETLRNYYKNHKTFNTSMHLIVDGPRVRLYYTMNCFSYRMDCSPKENADPNGWVIHQSNDATQLVLLFDGTGEASDTPFPGSPYDK